MKPKFITTPNGLILTSAIHGILYDVAPVEGEEAAPPNAVLLLSCGTHHPTGRPFDEVRAEVVEALEASPLTGMVPEIATAMAQLRERLQSDEADNAPEPTTGKGAVAKTGKGN